MGNGTHSVAQSAPQWLMEAMRWISELGHTRCSMSLVIVVSLAARRNVGIRTLQFLSLSGFYMVLAKDFFQHPRPYWLGRTSFHGGLLVALACLQGMP